jgi:isopentenyl phosphate kinase
MKISRVRKSAATVVETDNLTLLVSYSTPVAAVVYGTDLQGVYVSDEFYSVTTSRHISEFLRDKGPFNSAVEEKHPGFFQDLLEGR